MKPVKVVAYVPDLMDRSKVASAAPGATFVARPEDLASVDADLVVIDLTRPGAVEVIPGITARTVMTGKTGIEMEAFTAAAVAALTLYDMVKAMVPGATITDLRLLEKSGGKTPFRSAP